MKKPPQDMLDLAINTLAHAHAPYSNFPVAACIRAADGSLHTGCNVENAAFPLGACAEAGAVSAMVANGQKKIKEVLILVPGKKTCPPCGACRQRLLEFSPSELRIYLCTTNGDYKEFTLSELLPEAFGPEQLEKK